MTESNEMTTAERHRDPKAAFYEVAVRVGLIREGDPLDQREIDFAQGIVELCAAIGDRYTLEHDDRNAGEHIRAEFFD